MVEAGADLVLIAPPSTARAQMSALSLAAVLRLHTAQEIAVTVTTWDRSLISLQADLLGAQACGIANVVCRTGSPPPHGDYPDATGIWDVDSVGLIELLRSLNEGRDGNGIPIRTPSTFLIGARVNPGAEDVAGEVARARAKLAAGADYLVTWPVYDLERLRILLDELGGERRPVLVAVRPLRDLGEAEYLRYEVPDVHVPDEVVARLERAPGREAETGLELARELIGGARDLAEGVILSRTDEDDATWNALIRAADAQ
jgi:homocysteine S-methyltransferase